LVIHSDVANSGSLWANGGNITIDGAVTGSGTVQIDCQATVAFGAASSENTIFGQGAGTLELSQSDEFTGAISGFGTNDRIDLSNIAFATSMTASYAPNQDGTGGTLTVSDGIVTANIAFVGDYQATGFQVASDGQGGSVVTYAPPSDGAAAGDAAPGSVPIPDVFAFKPDFGNVTVSDFNPGFDSIEIDHSIFADAAALLAATQDDGLGNAVVTADAHDTITLLNVTKSQLSAHQGDFHVT